MSADSAEPSHLTLRDLEVCFEGAVPAVIATAAADGTPNVTYLSRIRRVDEDHVALSNQFFSKTSRNLAENPRASVLLIDPLTYEEFRVTLVYERTVRRGALFDQLRDDVDAVAALSGMEDVFRLRSADVYRVLDIEQVVTAAHRRDQGAVLRRGAQSPTGSGRATRIAVDASALGELTARLGRCGDLDVLVGTALELLDSLLGYRHSLLLLLDETGSRLFTIATHGYDQEGVGSEVVLGQGVIGMAAARAQTIRVGNLGHMDRYAGAVERSVVGDAPVGPGYTMPVPGLTEAESRLAVPAMAMGQLVGVLCVDSPERVAFGPGDEALLGVVASLVANAVEIERARVEFGDENEGRGPAGSVAPVPDATPARVRFFAVDGSTFLDDEYLIKGVAGRILWSLLGCHERDGRTEFTNKEVRLDPTLELPELRDNLESRLILLKRRLDERGAPIRIEKSGRGRFRLQVDAPLRLDAVGVSAN